MYEIWLGLNIFFELVREQVFLLLGLMALWLGLMLMALATSRAWRRALGGALVAGGVGLLAGILAVPALTRSSLAAMQYWVDWVTLFGLAAGLGLVVFLFAWPVLALIRRQR